jgi:hypothetical protein
VQNRLEQVLDHVQRCIRSHNESHVFLWD